MPSQLGWMLAFAHDLLVKCQPAVGTCNSSGGSPGPCAHCFEILTRVPGKATQLHLKARGRDCVSMAIPKMFDLSLKQDRTRLTLKLLSGGREKSSRSGRRMTQGGLDRGFPPFYYSQSRLSLLRQPSPTSYASVNPPRTITSRIIAKGQTTGGDGDHEDDDVDTGIDDHVLLEAAVIRAAVGEESSMLEATTKPDRLVRPTPLIFRASSPATGDDKGHASIHDYEVAVKEGFW